jgi:biopolymer transport protein ExbB/TolQ
MTDTSLWWIALGLGLVVAVVAVVLLQILYTHVRKIESVAAQIWHTGKQVAGNTANTWQLQHLGEQLDGTIAEAGRHDAMLRKG